ncbi:unnamed protein product [Rhodiola kirilowii]
MVVIESEPENVISDQKISVATSSEPNKVEVVKTDDASSSGMVSGAEAASDGFETASEGEFGEEASDDEIGKQEEKQQRQQTEVEKRDAEADAVLDEALKQKALEQANEAKVGGNKLFVEGQYEEALLQYELALQIAPDMSSSVELRSICHSNRGTCFSKLGKYEDTIKECKKALELNPNYMKALIRRADAYEKLEHFEEAIADLNKIIELDPSNNQARITKRRLEPLAAEKREKMKEEMIAKLKDMGNSVLGRFGMSIDNFKTVQDPNTGAYSVQFQK